MRVEGRRVGALRSGAFRFALLLASVFAAGSAVLLAVVQDEIGRYGTRAIDTSLQSETSILTGQYGKRGLTGLIDTIRLHQPANREAEFSYLVLGPGGGRIYGDLPASAGRPGSGLVRSREAGAARSPGDVELMKQLGTPLPGGLLLVVATDAFDVETLRAQLLWFTLLSGIGITAFALVGGYLVGRLFVGRLNGVNSVVERIMDGDLDERLPAIGFSPEFDALSANLNRMLDRNAALMEGLRQVSADIAHDLRTPLTRLHQQLQHLKDEEACTGGVDEAISQTEQLLAIFHALLRIGSLEGGVGRSRLAPVDLSEVMDRVHLAYRPVAEDGGHRLIADHRQGVWVNGDADLLAQLFTNLVENAIVHTPPGAEINIRLYVLGERVYAEVSDDGSGIPKEEHAKVFQRFYRRDASRQAPGVGLGLSLVAAIAALHQAEVSLDDNEPGLRIVVAFHALTLPKGGP